MKISLILSTLLLSLSFFTASGTAQQPALIDREIFFGNPEYAGAQISPDGKYISFIKPLNDVRNVWVKGVDEPFEKARPLTAEKKRPISGYFWSQDGKYILFTKDNDGDENFNVFSVDPSTAPAAGSAIPAPTNLTNAKDVRVQIVDVPESDPDTIFIGINDRDKSWHDLYKVQISTGKKTLVRENKDRLTGWEFDHAGNLRMARRAPADGTTEILKVDGDKFTVVYTCGIFESCGPVQFDKDNKLVYFVSNKGDRDKTQLVLFDPETGKEQFVEQDPMKRVDFGNAWFSDRTKKIVATFYTDDKTRIYWKDKSFETDYNYIKKQIGDREIAFGSSTKDESKFVVTTYSDLDPGTVWIFDRKSKNLSTLYTVREKLPRTSLSPMKAIRYQSSDGLEIPAYLTLPKGLAEKNLPLIVVPHGGPWARDGWGYNGLAQFLANRGYAVLQPNFRGSTGFGKSYLDAANLQWGDKMQDDITWGVKHLVKSGIADQDRVGIMGGSYGGYATLAGVTFTPDLYKAAVAIVAPSSLKTLLESIPPYWEAGRVIFHKRMGDPNTPEGAAQLKRQSPLFHADKIKTPLMIVQGAKDPRVKKREADQMVVALRDRNYPVQYLLAEDEGHGFARPVNNMAMYAAGEKFLAKFLGGRFQESMTPEVSKRLGEITIDPKSVVVEQPKDMSAAPATDLTGKWSMVVTAGAQQIPVALEIAQKGADFNGSTSSHLGSGTIEAGKVSGSNFAGTMKTEFQGQMMEIKVSGKVEGGKLSGMLDMPGIGSMPFVATKN